MKSLASNFIKISVLIFIIILTTSTSCVRRNTPKNYFKIGDTTYDIKSGDIINNGEVGDNFNLDLRLYDESKKNFINFNIISPQAESVLSNTYTEFEGSWVLGHDENGSYSNMASFNTGRLVINRSSDGYSIEVECIDQYSTEVKAYYKGKLTLRDENNLVHKLPDYVLPEEIYNEVTQYIPIHSGVNPPDMKGEYISSPHALIYESYAKNPDSLQFYSDRYLGFIYINKQMNFYGKQYDSIERKYIEEIQYGVKITGNNDNFTCYYVVDGYVQGYYSQQSFIFSGKKTESGLKDFYVAVVLLENSGNPNMYEKHSYRVLKDYDGLAETNNWLSGRSNKTVATHSINSFDIWMK